MLSEEFRRTADQWLSQNAPGNHIAISSRARYARNLNAFRFAPHAPSELLPAILESATEAIVQIPQWTEFSRFLMPDLRPAERHFLRECRMISMEMEKSVQGRAVYISPDCRISLMINEEDHLRIQCIRPGRQLHETLSRLNEVESTLSERLDFAFSERLGYLTACPTNTGTGLRVSVMLHLPALTLMRRVEELLQGIAPYGMTVRGFNGENSEFQGDLYQISNEISLGKSEEEILEILERVVDQVIKREEESREELLSQRRLVTEDVFWRSWATLAHSRIMNSQEAMRLLSRLRFGVDVGIISSLTHSDLNRLLIEIQPAHLELGYGDGSELSSEVRDELRAKLLRQRLNPSPTNA